MKSRFVGHRFLKQANSFVTSVAFSKRSVRLIRAENKRTQLYLQIELAEEKVTFISLTEVTMVSTTNVLQERKRWLL